VILAVDTSIIAVGYILFQVGEDGKRYPNRFGSITLNEVESRYSQAKLELYGLFHALRAVRIYTFGIANFTVELDAKYVKGMINNPDLQPNTTINRWIAGILLFSFKLVHVPAEKHAGPDGLSCRPQADSDPPILDDHEDWLDDFYSFSMTVLNDRGSSLPAAADLSLSLEPTPRWVEPLIRMRSRIEPPFYFSFMTPATDVVIEPSIPRSAKAALRETKVGRIRAFLETQDRPPDLSEAEYASFINSVTRFFLLDGSLWRREPHGRHQLVVPEEKRYRLIKEAHDDLGHKGVFTVRTQLLLRFWWPLLVNDVKWYIRTCHECQIRQTTKLHIPPSVPVIGGLFHKAHINMMLMPKAGGYRYIVQARCALSAYPEWRMLRAENGVALAAFIFEDILCRWGPLAEIVTDNGPPFIQALDILASRYNIHHIRISPYNSQANGIVEHRHYDDRFANIKSAEGDESRWYRSAHSVFWVERVTIGKSTGLSPYFMVHGVEPLFPFDLAEATYLVPLPDADPFSTTGLIAWQARQLQKRQVDLDGIRSKVLKSCFVSIKQFEETFKN
jgi:hypothetical protein